MDTKRPQVDEDGLRAEAIALASSEKDLVEAQTILDEMSSLSALDASRG